MTCPNCDSDDLNNLGGKRQHDTFDTRRYECDSCGHRFMTVEKHYRPIRSRSVDPDVNRPGEV